MSEINRISNLIVISMPADNTDVFALAAFREVVSDIVGVNIRHYIDNAHYALDTISQGAKSLNPDKYDILCDLCHEIIERKQGLYKDITMTKSE